eukprot:TRINITY_DN23955_c0_g1_i1.p1 TRINITY_DN23955_c0_g1~~TRINITY_DN23955_c0_g1_i1.p1  ORF type:complete len:1351 (-),score=366.53 TRINITY_DN23955_c0_g1_i1:152-4117(-)
MSCRALAYVGTEFDLKQVGLAKDQRATYNAAALFWQKVWKQFKRFVSSKDLRMIYQRHYFRGLSEKRYAEMMENLGEEHDQVAMRLRQFFWGSQQRFFKAMCNAAKVPAACVAAQEAVDRGEQVVMSIWATGEARSQARMSRLKEQTPGRCIIDSVAEGGIVEVTVKEQATLKSISNCLYSNLRLKNNLMLGKQQVTANCRLAEVDGKRINKMDDLADIKAPCKILFRSPTTKRLTITGRTTARNEPVRFELADDALGERVIIAKVVEGPDDFRTAEREGWHIKTLGTRPVGKLQVKLIQSRLRVGMTLGFQDAVISDHLSGPEMILEHFIQGCFLHTAQDGTVVEWAKEVKDQLLAEMKSLELPPNAMDAVFDNLGGSKKVAELSGRSHRMKRRKDGSFAYVARCEELRCKGDDTNMVEQVLFQKGQKKICVVTEVASAGISLHADRRQVRKDFQPPRRTMISVELPWGADKAIQVLGRVHRANQLVPPKFLILSSELAGEIRFNSAIARRMKLLGAVTKGDRGTSMGGVADRHMSDFDVNNVYGRRALDTLYKDTCSVDACAPELLAVYESMPFIGADSTDDKESDGWATWEDFARDVHNAWGLCSLHEEMVHIWDNDKRTTDECQVINRFFNRILMLEVHVQNAIFETFFAIYAELVRVDRANGVYDEGIDNLNRAQGRSIQRIEVKSRETLYKDPATGAETRYLNLLLDRGITWEVVREAYDALEHQKGSIEGFYSFRIHPDADTILVLVKEKIRVGGAGSSGSTWISRRRRKEFVVWRPDDGAQSRHGFGGKAYFEQDFIGNEQYTRLGSSEEDLKTIEKGWRRLYENSAESRLDNEHLLTGDVLSAWRLLHGDVKKYKSKTDSPNPLEAQEPNLRIARAVCQPDNESVVGMLVDEKDIPNLKYFLSCQQVHAQAAAKVNDEKEKLGVREFAATAAELLLQKLYEVGEPHSLPYKSWLDVHKVLSEEGIPRSVDGLRAVQLAVMKLEKKRLIDIDTEAGCMMLHKDTPEDEVEKPRRGNLLEVKLWPEDFVIEDSGEEGEKVDFDEEDEASDDDGEAKETAEKVSSVSTPARAKSDSARKRGRQGAKKEKTKDRRSTKRRKSAAEGGTRVPAAAAEDMMFKELFGDDDFDDEDWDFDFDDNDGEEEAFASAAAGDSPNEKKRQREDEMAQALFGDFDAFSDGEDEKKANDAKKSRTPASGETPESLTPPPAATTGSEKKPSDDQEQLASPPKESRKMWTYKVTGKKISIRAEPKVSKDENGEKGEYLKSGVLFKVSERVDGEDGRTYLRLADGRGWAYDRSAKDIDKIVVEEISSS